MSQAMKKALRQLLLAALMLTLASVFSVAATIPLFPFWSWLESFSGIESVGHSGPAGWCFDLVFLLFLVAAAVVLRVHIRRQNSSMQRRSTAR